MFHLLHFRQFYSMTNKQLIQLYSRPTVRQANTQNRVDKMRTYKSDSDGKITRKITHKIKNYTKS